jgi:RecA/RadA recombinase
MEGGIETMSNRGEGETDSDFIRLSIPRITTGSSSFDDLLGGGLPVCCLVDVFGAAGTGKTQFSFQNAVTTCKALEERGIKTTKVVFVDCTGSFRPERIVEIADNRSISPSMVLDSIFSISVRSASAQIEVNQRIVEEKSFSDCRLLIVDDITSNFVSDFTKESEIPARQRSLSLYARSLSYLANRRGLTILASNSIRSRGDLGEGETTGEVLSEFSLYRLHFTRSDRKRYSELIQPRLTRWKNEFEIRPDGIN